MDKNDKKPYLILLLCFLLQGGTLGIVVNCRGIFTIPVCSEIKTTAGTLMSYSLFYGVAVCAAIPLARRLINGNHFRAVITIGASVTSLAEYMLSFCTSAYQWYLVAAIQGACYSILTVLTVPMLINNWFLEKRGTFMGIASMSGGIVGAVMNMIVENVVKTSGWRIGYKLLGVTMFIMMVGACAAFAWRTPDDVGSHPLGKVESTSVDTDTGTPAATARKTGTYRLIILFTALLCGTVGFSQALSPIANEYGLTDNGVSVFVSLSMIGIIVLKMVVGIGIDRLGVRKTSFVSTIALMAAFILLLLGRMNRLSMDAGAFMMGLPMSISMILIQAMVLHLFGKRDFVKIYSDISIALNLASNFSFTLIGWVATMTGRYVDTVFMGLIFSALALAVVIWLYRTADREGYGWTA